jgi:hypothetical protein
MSPYMTKFKSDNFRAIFEEIMTLFLGVPERPLFLELEHSYSLGTMLNMNKIHSALQALERDTSIHTCIEMALQIPFFIFSGAKNI